MICLALTVYIQCCILCLLNISITERPFKIQYGNFATIINMTLMTCSMRHGNRPISQIPQCIRQIICCKNVHMYTVLGENGAMWDWCIIGFDLQFYYIGLNSVSITPIVDYLTNYNYYAVLEPNEYPKCEGWRNKEFISLLEINCEWFTVCSPTACPPNHGTGTWHLGNAYDIAAKFC